MPDEEMPLDEAKERVVIDQEPEVEVEVDLPPDPPENKVAVPQPVAAYVPPKAPERPLSEMIPEERAIAIELKQMAFRLKIAEHFFRAKCFTSDIQNPEQAFIKIQAGAEMGMTPMRAMKGLCIIKGQVTVYGVETSRRLREHGWSLAYTDESAEGVTVTIKKGDEEYSYVVKRKDEKVLEKSQAMGFAPKQKMRWFGLAQLLKFNVPEVLNGLTLAEEIDDLPSIPELVGAGKIDAGLDRKARLRANKSQNE